MKSEDWIDAKLRELSDAHQLRSLATWPKAGGRVDRDDETYLNFASNDYLDFLNRPEIKAGALTATQQYGAGSGASRLVTGNLSIHDELESAIAARKGYPSALFFGSGYMVNVGTVSSVVGRDDTVIADRMIHASLIDAAKLSGARLIRFAHNDSDDLARRIGQARGRILIMTESVFSMDGDRAPLPEMAELAQAHDAMLLVDEAHATGVFGPSGRGLIAAARLQDRINFNISTFSKALGGYGGAVCCSERMREWLINKARSFIYSTATTPAMCGAALAALALLDAEPDLGDRLQANASFFRDRLIAHGFDTGSSSSQIIPVMIGDNQTTMKTAAALRSRRIIAAAMRPPTVPVGTSRLRFSVTLAHTRDDLAHTVDALIESAREAGWRK